MKAYNAGANYFRFYIAAKYLEAVFLTFEVPIPVETLSDLYANVRPKTGDLFKATNQQTRVLNRCLKSPPFRKRKALMT